jgi:hypothetical protein
VPVLTSICPKKPRNGDPIRHCRSPRLRRRDRVVGYRVELLYPQGMAFVGRTPQLALAWCLIYLIYLMGEAGEIGTASFRH